MLSWPNTRLDRFAVNKSAYRRLAWSRIWHFCRDCHYWPTEHYVETTIPPDPAGLCRICKLKEDWNKCA